MRFDAASPQNLEWPAEKPASAVHPLEKLNPAPIGPSRHRMISWKLVGMLRLTRRLKPIPMVSAIPPRVSLHPGENVSNVLQEVCFCRLRDSDESTYRCGG